jgi:mannose-6-phosphate isomerase-like protein (cupin superfamily)
MPTLAAKVLEAHEGLRLQSGPGRDLVFKITGEETAAPSTTSSSRWRRAAGRHSTSRHAQEETVHVLRGRFKIQIGDETFRCAEGGFAYLPSGVPHTFLNLTERSTGWRYSGRR